MHQLATEVFYSRNHFEIEPVEHRRFYYYHDDACFLLPLLQANAVRSLQQITIYIPPELVRYLKDNQLRGLLRHVKEPTQSKWLLRAT
jgi:predicted metal-dependent peptidase